MSDNIVITGEGIVSAIGMDKMSVYNALKACESGIGTMRYLRSVHKELPVGEVKMSDDEMKSQLDIPATDVVSRTALMGMIAVKQALQDANVGKSSLRVLLISGTTVGGMDVTERYYDEMHHSDAYLDCLHSHDCGGCTAAMANHFDVFEDYTTISTACSSSANAIMLGARMLKEGLADMVVAGGTEALSVFHLNGFNSLMILDKERCRPFDATRAGLNLGEGAAFVVMESESSAMSRGAEVHAYVSGYGNACDAFHQTASSEDGEGAYRAMSEALSVAGLKPADIQYVNAHGTGTVNNDISECQALKRVFGSQMPLVSSTKSFTGHTTSASGSIETVICLLALRHQFVPGNIGWSHPIEKGINPTLGVDHCDIHHVVCNSFGFGGNDTSLIFSDKPTNTRKDKKIASNIKVVSLVEISSDEEVSEIRNYVKPMETRRMDKLMKSALLSSFKALEQAGIKTPDAIITGTALGCLENSEKLLKMLCENGEQTLKPTLFMQSTHNTVSSAIAIWTKCHGYNITYSQQDKSLEWAIQDAMMLLQSGKVKNVLVGCHDETTEDYRNLMRRLGKDNMKSINSTSMVLTCGA